MTSRVPKPEPIVVETVCSLCDQPWEDHGETPTTADCIRLLKQQLALRPAPTIAWHDYPWTNRIAELPQQQQTWIYPSTYTSGNLSASSFTDNVFQFRKPDDGDDGSAPVPAVT